MDDGFKGDRIARLQEQGSASSTCIRKAQYLCPAHFPLYVIFSGWTSTLQAEMRWGGPPPPPTSQEAPALPWLWEGTTLQCSSVSFGDEKQVRV